MRTVFLALCLGLAMVATAQLDFGSRNDGDTLLSSFQTELENDVYAYLRDKPVLPEEWKLLSLSPVTIKMKSVKAGWDIIVLDPAEGKVSGFLYDFSWNATELQKSIIASRLAEIIAFKEKSPR